MEPDTLTLQLWRFVRGDMAVNDFERWAYAEDCLESFLGDKTYLDMISADFRDAASVWSVRYAVADFLRTLPGPSCMCIRLRDLDMVDMGTFQAPEPAFEKRPEWSHDDVMRTWDQVAKHGPPLWWLWVAHCRECGQGWLIGQEERQNDVFCVRRLLPEQLQEIVEKNVWPPDFDLYETMLRLGCEWGRRVHFIHPYDSSLRYTTADLARERPGIKVSELARLLNLELAAANELASRVVAEEQVEITFDSVRD